MRPVRNNKKERLAIKHFSSSGCNIYTNYDTANPSKLIEKFFLDLRKIFSNHENIRKFFSKQEELSSQEKFSHPFHKNIYLNLRKSSQNKNNFLEIRNIFLVRKVFLMSRKLILF